MDWDALVAALPAAAFSFASVFVTSILAERKKIWRDAKKAELAALGTEDRTVWEELSSDDVRFIKMTQDLLKRTPPPVHSGFLVCATVSYWDKDRKPAFIQGCNSETCVIGSSICAERCALLQLRIQPEGYKNIRAVYITTSSDDLITPGVLCREFMCEFGPPETRIVLFTGDYAPRLHPLSGKYSTTIPQMSGNIKIHRLGDLYPFAPIYHTIPRAASVAAGRALSLSMQPFTAATITTTARGLNITPGTPLAADISKAILCGEDNVMAPDAGLDVLARRIVALYEQVTALAAATTPHDMLHVIHYAAGILFSDGSVQLARTDKCLEYGCTVDACVKLTVAALHQKKAGLTPNITPLVMLHVDQFGICHAPHAKARAWFHEYGYDSMRVYVHAVPKEGAFPWAEYGCDVKGWDRYLETGAFPAPIPILKLQPCTIEQLCPAAPQIEL